MNYKLISLIFLFLYCFNSKGQVISGSVTFQNDRTNFDFIIIDFGGTKTSSDSKGNFTVTKHPVKTQMDTLIVIPFPEYIKVKLINIPVSYDTIILSGIPLFKDVDNEYPIIHFNSKRASKKYFKKLEKVRKVEESHLKQEVEDYVFHWKEVEYRLRLEKDEMSSLIIIDLKK